jgi:hypothetical protein
VEEPLTPDLANRFEAKIDRSLLDLRLRRGRELRHLAEPGSWSLQPEDASGGAERNKRAGAVVQAEVVDAGENPIGGRHRVVGAE